jgi:predicted transcriptional regulator
MVYRTLIRTIKEWIHVDETMERILNEPVTAVMTRCPLPVHTDTPLSTILERFSSSSHPLVVVEKDGRLAGVITPMDLISVLVPAAGPSNRHLISGLDRFLKSAAQNAEDVMSDEPLTLPEGARISDALREMEHGYSSSIILIDTQNVAVGCVELTDIIAYLFRSEPR